MPDLDHGKDKLPFTVVGRLWKDGAWGEDKELRYGDVKLEMHVRYPVEILGRELDTEMWDSY